MEAKIIIILFSLAIFFFFLWRQAQRKLTELEKRKNSLATRYGKMTEQFLPFLKNYPYSAENFRFIGSPIDGIQFEEDKIILIEFKSGDSKLTSHQEEIKDQVEKGKVKFEEWRIE